MIEFTANPYQDKFIRSSKRYPCLAGAWATGKTLSAISRAELYSRLIPNNLGCIFRKTARSLNDSTLQDFQKYTGHKVNADRNFDYPNGSRVMFRHLDELQSINQQNINLGWFYIEQAEELDSDREFWMLIGRLRRDLVPSPAFVKLGMAVRSGWVIANAGDNWVRKLWRDRPFEGSELIEATTWDNAHNLPQDFLDSLKVLELSSPDIYKQFVLNCWDVATSNRVFPTALLEHMILRQDVLNLSRIRNNIGVAVDPSGMGVDSNVFMAGNDGLILDVFERTIMSASEKAVKALEMCKRVNGWWILVDCDGIGAETYKELIDLPEGYRAGIQIIAFNGSAPARQTLFTGMGLERPMYANMRAEAAFVAQRRGYNGMVGLDPSDKLLREDLEADTAFCNGRGLQQLTAKDEIKKIIKRSPGRGDCWKMLQWGFEQNYDDQTYHGDMGNPEYRHEEKLQQYAIGV